MKDISRLKKAALLKMPNKTKGLETVFNMFLCGKHQHTIRLRVENSRPDCHFKLKEIVIIYE